MKPVLHPAAVSDYARYFEYLRENGASVKTLENYLDAATAAPPAAAPVCAVCGGDEPVPVWTPSGVYAAGGVLEVVVRD